MHQSSYEKMLRFRQHYLAHKADAPLVIHDLGSMDVNGCYRPIFSEPRWRYVGIDMAAGANVDLVLQNAYIFREIASNTVDVVVSGQAFEHIRFFWITMLEIVRVLRPGGLCCILAPSSGYEHRYPYDCWRFYPDGMHALAAFAAMEVLEVSTQWEDQGYTDGSDAWHDTLLVCRKPDHGPFKNFFCGLKCALQHRALTIGMR
jgi:SAM-dependent methyltransferase